MQQDDSVIYGHSILMVSIGFTHRRKSLSFFDNEIEGPSILPSPVPFIDKASIAWVGTHGDGLFRMDTRRPGQFVSYNPGGVVANIIYEVYLAADHLWLATSDGLRRVNPRTNQVVDYGYEVSTTYKDRLGNLWVGTSNGVSKAVLYSSPFYTTPASPIRKENDILNILEDHSGTVWVGTSGKGLCRFDRTTQRMSSVTVNPADSRSSIEGMQWPLLEDGKGQLWVGTDTDKGLYLLDRKANRFTRYSSKISVRVMTLAPSGIIWLGGDTGEIAAFDPATKTFTYFPLEGSWVQAILVSQSGDVWVSSYDGLIRLNPTTGNVTRYMPNLRTPAGSLNDKIVFTLYEDEEGIIWIGTAEGGLNRLDPITQVFTNFTTREGLPSNQVNSIMGDERGNLWLGTTQGLCRFNPTTHTCRNFDESDGLLIIFSMLEVLST